MKQVIPERKAVSISEFFDKNKQMLGFDSPQKALFMTVKEAVDNSLDACGDFGIMPEITVVVENVENDKFRVTVADNGPGIPRREVADSFGKMLYGSRFHIVRQTRGQQGLGISAAIMYAQKTTGQPTEIWTKTKDDLTGFHFVMEINIKRNEPDVHKVEPFVWNVETGLRISLILKGKLVSGKQSVEEYIRETAIANPHATFHLSLPDKKIDLIRSVNESPVIPVAVKPHPHGVELGELMSIFRENEDAPIEKVLSENFSRVTSQTAKEIIGLANLKSAKISSMTQKEFEILWNVMRNYQFMEPNKECLSPIGEEALYKSVSNAFDDLHPAYFSMPVTKGPFVFSGHPFTIEAIAVYGGNIPKEEPVKVMRFANRVPLLYQPGSCAITKAISTVAWNQYGLSQPVKDQLPIGPVIIVVHIASTKIPYTSEAKEAIAPVPEILEALDIVLKGIGRQIRAMRRKEEHKSHIEEKFSLIEQILPAIGSKAASILKLEEPDIRPIISKVMGVIAFREEEGKLTVTNFTETQKSFAVVLKGEREERENVKNLKPFEKITLRFSREMIDSSEIYAGLPDKLLLGAYSLPEVFKNE